MFVRLYTHQVALFFAIPLLASASAISRDDNSCPTGPVQCCQFVENSSSLRTFMSALLGLLGITVGVDVGIACESIGENDCSAQTVCCLNNSFNGVITIGCTPINLGL